MFGLSTAQLTIALRVLWAVANYLVNKTDIVIENPDDDAPDVYRILPLPKVLSDVPDDMSFDDIHMEVPDDDVPWWEIDPRV